MAIYLSEDAKGTYLDTSDFLQQLIGTGPDASLNLFNVRITPYSEDNGRLSFISMRTTQFVTPKRDSVTTQIPYQNTVITIPTSGTQIDRTITLPVRVDDQMEVMSLLREYQLLKDALGNYEKDKSKSMTITITSMDTSFKSSGVYKWIFHDCYIMSVSPLTYDYNSSNTGNVNVSFIYSYFDEIK